MNSGTVVAAFSEDQTERLTGVTKGQLRYWDRTDFYQPSFGEENRRLAYSRVYSFKDIVALRILGALKNQCNVSLQHLRKVSERLAMFGPDTKKWTAVELYVLDRKVVWHEPGTELPQQILSQQYVLPTISLKKVVEDTHQAYNAMRGKRDADKVGQIEKNRFVSHNRPVLAGTRIPVSAIRNFADAGYDEAQILQEYPDLTAQDVQAALAYEADSAAA